VFVAFTLALRIYFTMLESLKNLLCPYLSGEGDFITDSALTIL